MTFVNLLLHFLIPQNLQSGLKMSGVRGYVCMFKTLAHKCTAARLAKQDEEGYSLMHHAAMFNKPLILQLLKIQKQDLNCRRNSLTSKQGKGCQVCVKH